MNGRDLVRAVKDIGTERGRRAWRAAWRHRRSDAVGLPRRGAERARVPGLLTGTEARPGGGVLRFARSDLLVRVMVGGAVFWSWDGAGPTPSYAVVGEGPEPDPRAVLEPDTGGGWRVVSERVTVAVSRHGALEVRTPGGAVLRREAPPRWWEPVDPRMGAARWLLRSEVPADARFFGLGGRAAGPRLRDGAYRLWNTDPKGGFGPGVDPLYLTMPVQMVVADAGTHLVFHDNSWDGRVVLREGEEGAGSGADRPGASELRMEGGPLRCWVLVGTPARVLQGWSGLTGAAAVPPEWALGYQHARWGFGSAEEVRRVVAGYASRGLALSAVHLDIDHYDGHRVFTVDAERFPDLPELAQEMGDIGVRLVSIVDPAVKAGDGVHTSGLTVGAGGAFVRDARGGEVRGEVWPGECAYPDFTDPAVREWWGGLYEERLKQGFAGFWHDMNEPVSFAPFGDTTLPRSARHALDGAGGDHREGHNVYALGMARAGWEGLVRLRPAERPFLFSRSGWAGMQRYGGTWSGDVESSWEGLRASLALVLGLGLCGVPYSGPDVGGFGGSPSPELYVRWLQLGAYLPLFRTHSAIWAGRREPWEFGPEVAEQAAAVMAERERLRPYFVTLAHLARRTGAPYVRPLWWGAPEERQLRDCEDTFLLGDALLVAPVLECGADRRAVRLPRGRWYDTATGAAYEGPGQILLDAPQGRIPVLARAGAVLPVRAGSGGGVELEVWAPARGRTGGGVVIRDPGPGFEPGAVERYTVRWVGDAVVVEDEAGNRVQGVTVRGL
ncbi:glycoside hydrolase family 31 protein [Streptomyces virginiae]|uniref:glycoside hydrolase family 31 protein n=1 Tax=Streptomyces virginiae TaxID=1961 RepID=UPI002253C849|nr:glycoside hydrolase family 31 protein [Streptomyces virginiae]MCX4961505.1 glycoside hydrolase family 31 protein [Streptomyces virginiae]MCX5180549.1 glycoside hydrolase family 31 protein [Streptomyces virginiae]